MYGAVAGFGLTAVSSLLVRQQDLLRAVGGLFLCYLGARTFLARPADGAARGGGRGILGAFASTLGLTLANPATILSFVAVFAGFGIAAATGWRDAAILVAGVFLGSALWWLVLSGAVGALRTRLDHRALRWVNRMSGLVLLAFGATALLWR